MSELVFVAVGSGKLAIGRVIATDGEIIQYLAARSVPVGQPVEDEITRVLVEPDQDAGPVLREV